MSTSDPAELSTLRAQIDDLVERLTPIAERYGASSDSAIATDLFSAERALLTAGRSLERALAHLEE
jgi:hypothetical protein